MRAGETLVRAGDKALLDDFRKLGKDADANVVLQAVMTGKYLASNDVKAWPEGQKFAQATLMASTSKGVRELGAIVLTGSDQVGGREYSPAENAQLAKGQAIYRELCFACHGYDGKGMAMEGGKPGMTIAPPLSGSADVRSHRDAIVRVLLNGLTGPIAGKTYDAQMVAMGMNDDAWIAAVSSYVRNSFGNHGACVTEADVARVRAELKGNAAPWTVATLQASLPKPMSGSKEWKVGASDQADTAPNGCDADAKTMWVTKENQKKGMWYQIELPAEQKVAGLRMEAPSRPSAFPLGYKVEGSVDGKKWVNLATTHGLYGMSEVFFEPKSVKFLKLTLTNAANNQPWAIQELQLFAP